MTIYHAYLLRLRYLDNGGQPLWVYSLESPDGNERHEFRTLAALTAFLERQTPPCGNVCRWRQSTAERPTSGPDQPPC